MPDAAVVDAVVDEVELALCAPPTPLVELTADVTVTALVDVALEVPAPPPQENAAAAEAENMARPQAVRPRNCARPMDAAPA